MSDFSKLGLSSLKDSSAFKKIQFHSKSPSHHLFDAAHSDYSKFISLNNLYFNTSLLMNSKDYYIDRQNNYSSSLAIQSGAKSNLDKISIEKYLAYNFNFENGATKLAFSNNFNNSTKASVRGDLNLAISNKELLGHTTGLDLSLSKLDSESMDKSTINATSDSKYYTNPLKPLVTLPSLRKNTVNLPISTYLDLSVPTPSSEVLASCANNSLSTKFKELASPNLGFLSSDKNSRIISKLHSSKGQFNLSPNSNNLLDIIDYAGVSNSSTSEFNLYSSSNIFWNSPLLISKLAALNSTTDNASSPVHSSNPY